MLKIRKTPVGLVLVLELAVVVSQDLLLERGAETLSGVVR
jgi:hypothetical protein